MRQYFVFFCALFMLTLMWKTQLAYKNYTIEIFDSYTKRHCPQIFMSRFLQRTNYVKYNHIDLTVNVLDVAVII